MKIIYTLFLAMFSTFTFGQDVLFSFDVDVSNAPDESVVTVYAEVASGTEQLSTFTTAFYYQDTNSDFDPATGWEADPASPFGASSTITSAANTNTNTAVSSYDTRIEVLADDPAFTGLTVGTEPVALYTLTFTDVILEGQEDFYIGAEDTEGATAQYFNSATFTFHPVNTTGDRSANLPILLKSFAAEKYTDNSAILNWTSVSEINASHYEVERSTDELSWEKVATVKTTGSEHTEANYELIDRDLPVNSRSGSTIFYYRLKMVDLDGAYEYSNIDAVRFEGLQRAGLFVFPNPTTQDVFVSVENVSDYATSLTIVDKDGRVVATQALQHGQDERVSLNTLPSGVFYFVVDQNGERLTEKVIKID